MVLRALVMLAVVSPLFAATAFRPAWWQVLIAAAIGSALGQVALRATRGHRVAAYAVAGVAACVALAAGVLALTHEASRGDPAEAGFLVIGSRDRGKPSLTWDDVRAIETAIPTGHLTVPYLHKAETLSTEDSNWKTEVVGTTPDYFDLGPSAVAAGERFTSSNPSPGKVVVLGETVVAQLFGAGKSPIGELVRINRMPFAIIGVLAHQGMTPRGQDRDDVALVPLEVYRARIGIDSKMRFGGTVLVSATARGDAARIEAEVRALLRDRHFLSPGADDDFVTRSSNGD